MSVGEGHLEALYRGIEEMCRKSDRDVRYDHEAGIVRILDEDGDAIATLKCEGDWKAVDDIIRVYRLMSLTVDCVDSGTWPTDDIGRAFHLTKQRDRQKYDHDYPG